MVVTRLAEMHAEMSLNSLCADLCSTTGDGTQAGASKKYFTTALIKVRLYPLGELQLGPKIQNRVSGKPVFSLIFVPRWRCGAVGLIYNLLCFKSKAYSKAVHHTAAPRHGAGSMVCKCM